MENKICTKCGGEKPLSEFLFKNKNKGVYHSACRICYKEIRKISYNKHKKTTYDRNKRNSEKCKKWFKEYKSNLKCSQCIECHPSCLEFHHLEEFEKDNNVSYMVGSYSIKAVKKEIAKCIVLCANCHRKLHYNETDN